MYASGVPSRAHAAPMSRKRRRGAPVRVPRIAARRCAHANVGQPVSVTEIESEYERPMRAPRCDTRPSARSKAMPVSRGGKHARPRVSSA
jgi:hypothetical protein